MTVLLSLGLLVYACVYLYSYTQAPWRERTPAGALMRWLVYGLTPVALPIVLREPQWLNGLMALVWIALALMSYEQISYDVRGMWRPATFRRKGGEGENDENTDGLGTSVDDLRQWLNGG